MEGKRELYKRDLMQRAAKELEDSRNKFWTDIDAGINEANSCESNAKRDAKEIWREQELMEIYLEGRLD